MRIYRVEIFFVLLIPLTTGLDPVQPSVGLSCPDNSLCATRTSCYFWAEKEILLTQLPRNSVERKTLIAEFRSNVCNKPLKALCCPVESPLIIVDPIDKSCPTPSICATRDSCQVWREKSS